MSISSPNWGCVGGLVWTYLSLQHAGVELVQCLARLVAVADVLEGLGCVLSGDIQHDLLTTAVFAGEHVSA